MFFLDPDTRRIVGGLPGVIEVRKRVVEVCRLIHRRRL